MKKSDNTRSHSWWWDSHISPKNSKWLQENLSEMDSKVGAMLKIVEADADSFAQRAEMFYKKRPELINLVEEFYRTYRALVERYTYLTREIRQNMAPALQAQLGVSSESAQNSPVDLHLKRGIDGPDIISPSYSYTGASDFDYDSPVSEVSAKAHTDDEFSPLGCRVNYERRAFGNKPRYPNAEESSHKASESGCTHDAGDVDIIQLQKELERLQEEHKLLTNKSADDVTKLKSLQLELSNLHARVRGLEAEDKLTKKRLKSVQEKEQKLEAENLKLSHSLMSSKEEKTELLEQQNRVIEDSNVARQLFKDQMVVIKNDLATAQSQLSEREEHLKRGEESLQSLRDALTSLREERQKDSFLMEIFEQQSEDLHKKLSELEEKNARLREESLTHAAEAKNLQHQLNDVMNGSKTLEQLLRVSKEELEEAQRDRKDLSDRIAQQTGEMARLKQTIENENVRAQAEKMEGDKYILKLEADLEEGKRAAETLQASSQQCEDRCKALEQEVMESEEKLKSSSEVIVQHQSQLRAFENTVACADLRNEELQKRVSSLDLEKTSAMYDLEKALNGVRVSEGHCVQMEEVIKGKQEEIEMLKQELHNHHTEIRSLEERFSHSSKERTALIEREAGALLAHQQLENVHKQLKQQLELNLTLSEDLKSKISSLEVEKSDRVLESQQLQQKLLDLQEENTVLSSHCLKSKAGLQAAEAATSKAKEEVQKLQDDGQVKAELIHRLRSEVESSEAHLSRAREEKSLLGEEIDKCTKKLADFEVQIHHLQKRLSESVAANVAIAEQVSQKQKSMELLEHELCSAQVNINVLNEDIVLRKSHALGLEEQINSLKEQVKLLYSQLHETSEAKCGLEALLRQKSSEAKEANEKLLSEQKKLLNDVLLLQEKNKDVEAHVSCHTGEREVLLQEASNNLELCNDLKHKIASLESDYEASQIQSRSLCDQLVELKEQKKVREDENKRISKSLYETEGRVQDLQLKVSDLLVDAAVSAEQLAERMGNVWSLEAAHFDLQKDNVTLHEEVDLLEQKVSALRTRETALVAEMHNGSEIIHSMRAEIERLQLEVSKAREAEKSFALEQKRSLDESVIMKEKIENLQKGLGLLAEEKVVFSREIATHSGRSIELDVKVKRLEAEKCSLQQELLLVQGMQDQLKEEVKNLLEERKQLSGVVAAQKEKMQKLEEDLQNLRLEVSFAKLERQSILDKLNLLTEEKVALLQELKESKHDVAGMRDNYSKLEMEFFLLQQVIGTRESELGNKMEEVKKLLEDALTLQSNNLELEQKLEFSSRQVIAQSEQVEALQETLSLAQQEKAKLETELVDAERRVVEAHEASDREKEGCLALTQELAAVFAIKKKLEEDLATLEEAKRACTQKLEKMQQDFSCLQEVKDQSVLHLEAARLQGQENETKLSDLQEQLDSVESASSKLTEKLSKITLDRGAAENALSEKKEEVLKLSIQVEALQQSVLLAEQESTGLRELLRKNKEDHVESERVLKDELCLVQNEVGSTGAQMIELHEMLSGVEKKNDMLLVELSLKENMNVELQREIQLLREETEELTREMKSTDAHLVQVKAISEGELLQLQEELRNSQVANQSNEACYQAQAQAQIEELTGALSTLQAEAAMLKAKLVDESSALSIMSHGVVLLKEENQEKTKKAGAFEARVSGLEESLTQARSVCDTKTREADNAAEEVSSLRAEAQDLLSQISDLNRQCREKHEKLAGFATNLGLLQQELAGAREENIRLSELAKKLQEQLSSLHDSKQDQENALELLTGRLKDSELMCDHAVKSKEASLHGLQGHTEKLLHMVSKIEDLDMMLRINPTIRRDLVRRHQAILSREDCPEDMKERTKEPQSIVSAAIDGEGSLAGKEPLSSPHYSLAADNCFQSVSPLPRDREPMKIRETNGSGIETLNSNQKSLLDASVDAVDRLKEKILLILFKEEDNCTTADSTAAMAVHQSSVGTLQEQSAHLQQEVEHLTSEVSLYKEDIHQLTEVLLKGNKLPLDGEVAHAEAKAVLAMLYAMQESIVGLEEESRALQEEVNNKEMEKRSLQLMLSEFQDKGLSSVLLLRENLLFSCKGIKLLAVEWDKLDSGREWGHQSSECIDKLIKLEESCTSSDMPVHDNTAEIEGEMLPSGQDKRSMHPHVPHSSVATSFVLTQLQKRVEEVILLRAAVEDLLPPSHWQDHCKEEEESRAGSGSTEESKRNMPTDKPPQSLLSGQEQQQWSFSIEQDSEGDIEEVDSIDDQMPERHDKAAARSSLAQAEEIDVIEGLARLHINLGMRLHQALMDEKLETELKELKEERRRLEEDLQARVEQVHRMETELERLQFILKEGSEEGREQDPKQQQQWLRRKRRAEKRAKRLSRELVLQRQQMGNLRSAVASWAEQEEIATEILEEQVLLLVDKEIAPTMEGWDPEQVNKLMEEMQSRKALTRRHSMDLHSVGQELQRVGSSIETTHRKLLRKDGHKEDLVQGWINKETIAMNVPGETKNHQKKLSRFGLTWLLLLFSTKRGSLFKRNRDSMPMPTSEEPPRQITESHASTSTSNAMEDSVAQTPRKMGCCACIRRSHQLKPSDDK